MHIQRIDIQNFRKLKCCQIEFSEKKTVFVGANNSGKTSAMIAMNFFLGEKTDSLNLMDITVSNWRIINGIGNRWLEEMNGENEAERIESDSLPDCDWNTFMPSMDVWFYVTEDDVYRVAHLLPSLDWKTPHLGIRRVFELKDKEKLHRDFCEEVSRRDSALEKKSESEPPQLWPQNLCEFLAGRKSRSRMNDYFEIRNYILDPERFTESIPQSLAEHSEIQDEKRKDPLKGLIRIDFLPAQREFKDTNQEPNSQNIHLLSDQLHEFYQTFLNPEECLTPDDLDILKVLQNSQKTFNQKLGKSFQECFTELSAANYPGFSDPAITFQAEINPESGLKKSSAIQYQIPCADPEEKLTLPENYNGLGFQNLISMFFHLISFRKKWLAQKEECMEPIHLVLLEEPEAHLHVQIQQVFIQIAYDILAKDTIGPFVTQLVVSTHSSHIAHKLNFEDIRYFRRKPADTQSLVPTVEVLNLSNTFEAKDSTTQKFVTRYIQLTHCDLFFADAAIFIEGATERILLPLFLENYKEDTDLCKLRNRYLSVIEVGGSHAHRFLPLIRKLKLPTLIITDLDACEQKTEDSSEKPSKAMPARNANQVSSNQTLHTFLEEKNLDAILDFAQKPAELEKDGHIRVAFPHELKDREQVIPYTFEDALIWDNLTFFQDESCKNILKKSYETVKEKDGNELEKELWTWVTSSSFDKGKFALDLLLHDKNCEFNPPDYIREGLLWLARKLASQFQSSTAPNEEQEMHHDE